MGMKGKTLVITGATKGIGKATAEKFAKNGVNVAFTYNSNKDAAEKIAREFEDKYGIKARAYQLDILDTDQFKPLFEAIDKDFERVDFFVSNAMIYGRPVVGGYGKFMKLRPKKDYPISIWQQWVLLSQEVKRQQNEWKK